MHVAYKKTVAYALKTHTGWKWRNREQYSMQIGTERAAVAILQSDKIDWGRSCNKRQGDSIMIKNPVYQGKVTVHMHLALEHLNIQSRF